MKDDEALLRKLAEGDDAALEALLTSHMPQLHGFVRLHAGPSIKSHEETVDLVQSVCREVLHHKERFAHPSENGFKRWLYRTAMRKIANRAQYWSAGKREGARFHEQHPTEHDVLSAYGTICSPSQGLAAAEEVRRIESAFDQLSETQRQVISLHRIAGLSHTAIAQELGKTPGAVRTILSRALARLSELLDESEPAD